MKPAIKFYFRKMEILTDNGAVARYYSDLVYAVLDDLNNCWLHFVDGVKYRVEVSLLYLQHNLPTKPFFRCNRTSIVNLCYYVEYMERSAMIIMSDGASFRLSVRNIKSFKKQKDGMTRISPLCPPCLKCNNEGCPDFGLFCLRPEQLLAEE